VPAEAVVVDLVLVDLVLVVEALPPPFV